MKRQILFYTIVLLLVSINAFCQDNTFQLNGKIDAQYNGNQIMLFTFQQDTIYSVDTTLIENGEFYFKGKEYIADFSVVVTGNYPDRVISSEVILNKGLIYVDIDSGRIWGGELNDKLLAFNDSIKKNDEQRIKLLEDTTALNYVQSLDDYVAEYIYSFMIENQNSLLGVYAFRKYLGLYAYNGSSKFEELCDIYDKERKSGIVQNYLKHWDKYARRVQAIGKKYDDFEFQTPAGNTRRLSDYIGKSTYVFIDFWASWCGPCIAVMPHLKDIYNKYRDQGFEIVGISLDTDKKSWIESLDRIDAPWIHLCNFEGIPSKLAEAYYLKGIPYGILIDKYGIIVDANLTATALELKMQKIFDDIR